MTEEDLVEIEPGIAQAPSRYSPLNEPELTRARRDEVLSAMAVSGFIGEAEAQAASARSLAVRPPRDFFRDRSPYFAEHVRRLTSAPEKLLSRNL